MLGEYVAGTSFAYRLDIRAKLVVFGVVTALTFLFTSPVPQGALAAGSIALLLGLGATPRQLGRMLLGVSPLILLVTGFAALSPPPGVAVGSDVIGHLWFGEHLPLTVAGVRYGVCLGLRLLTMVVLTSALARCTPVEQVTTLLWWLRLPYSIVFMVTTALRFVPTLQQRARQIIDAQRARGAAIDSGGVVRRVKAYVTVMVPLFTSGIRTSEGLAAAMLTRGYGLVPRPTPLDTLRMTWRDPLVIGAAVAVLIGAVWLRSRGVWIG